MKVRGLAHIILLVFGLLGASVHSKSQQDPLYSQYLHNMVSINPAYAGSSGNLNMTSLYRKQWVGFEGAPETMAISFNAPFIQYNIGAGLTFISDKIGPVQQTGLYLDYAYFLRKNKKYKLSLGLKGGFNYYQMRIHDLRINNSDLFVSSYDFEAPVMFNVGLGVFYWSKTAYLGASIPKILQNSLFVEENSQESLSRERRHYFVMGGTIFNVAKYIKLKPTFTTRIVNGSPVSLELTSILIVLERIWTGIHYRVADSVGGHIRFQIGDNMQLGYSYDLTNSRLGAYNKGTHEIIVNFDFSVDGSRVRSPRYM